MSDGLRKARAALEAERFEQASLAARQILKDAPDDAAALEIEGIARLRLGDVRAAVDVLKRAVRLDPSSAGARIALGNAHQEAGQLDAAIASLQRAVRLDPASAQGHNDLGAALYAKGRIREALGEFEEAARLDPASHTALENLGSALRTAGRFADARRALVRSLKARISHGVRRLLRLPARRPAASTAKGFAEAVRLFHAGRHADALAIAEAVLAARPDDAEALHLKGLWLLEQKNAEAAAPLLARAAAKRPDVAEFQNTLGNCHRAHGRASEALACYQRAVTLSPELTVAHNNAAVVLLEQEAYDRAADAATRALGNDHGFIPAHINLSRARLGEGRFEEAESAARGGLGIEPRNVALLLTLGQALREQSRLDDAAKVLEEALALAPQEPDVHLSLGAYYQDCRQDPGKALHHFREAQRLKPAEPGSFFNEGVLRLMQGEYSSASWELYEYRRHSPRRAPAYRKLPGRDWSGESARGKSLLLYGEQGIGDEIMFASMVMEAASQVGRTTLACDPRLQPLFARSFPGIRCIGWNRVPDAELAQAHDLVMPVGSLGLRLRNAPSSFPRRAGYLKADADRVRYWRRVLEAAGSGPYTGIAWRGGTYASGRARRSLDIGELARQVGSLDRYWISLQIGASDIELDAARAGLPRFFSGAPLESVDETAALIEALDEVVSVCCWVVHLAGALGKPVTVLAPYVPEWRYGLSGTTMAWYPSAHVIRQDAFGDWSSLLGRLRTRLAS